METHYLEAHRIAGLLTFLTMLLGASLVLGAPRLNRITARSYILVTGVFFLVTRVGLLAIIFGALGRPAGPDAYNWAPHGVDVIRGSLPYVDFSTPYGPLFWYLLAPAFFFFNPYLAPYVMFILFDMLAFLFLQHVGANPELNRRVATLYLITPLSWFIVVRSGQEESIGAFFVVLLLILARKRMENLLSVLAGIAAALTKILFLLPSVPILLSGPRGLRACFIAGSVLAGCYLPFVLLGGHVFDWVVGPRLIGESNIWSVFGLLGAACHWRLKILVFAIVAASLAGLVALRIRRMGMVNGALLSYAGYMISSPKACYPYVLLVLPVLCLRVAGSRGRRELIFFTVYSFVMVFFPEVPKIVGKGEFSSVQFLLSFGSILSIVAYHCYLVVTCIRVASVDERLLGPIWTRKVAQTFGSGHRST